MPVAVISLLPCFWIYKELGMQMMEYDHSKNPYSDWIKSYASESFQLSVDKIINISNKLNQQVVCPFEKEAIQTAFQESVAFELAFFEMAFSVIAEEKNSQSPCFKN